MAEDLNERKLRAVLVKANGEPQLAVRLLAQVVERDPQLLLAVTKPFLPGILQSAVDRTMKRVGMTIIQKAVTARPAVRRPAELTAEALDKIVEKLGAEFGSTRTQSAAPPASPEEALARVGIGTGLPPPPPASGGHQKSLAQMAKSFASAQFDRRAEARPAKEARPGGR
jgi:hypothetical protein